MVGLLIGVCVCGRILERAGGIRPFFFNIFRPLTLFYDILYSNIFEKKG
nr:MAG TPA: hypothetical protein [Caudoviricetes sp.]